jgi:hypothetical protein
MSKQIDQKKLNELYEAYADSVRHENNLPQAQVYLAELKALLQEK